MGAAITTREEILQAVANMSVMDLVQLVEDMEKKFNVSAAAAVTVAPAAGGAAAAPVEEQTQFDVVMTSFGAQKINVIKAVRELTSLALAEAKALVEAVPSKVKEGIAKQDAEAAKKKLEEAGATVEVK